MNGVQILVLGGALLGLLFVAFAFRKGREQRTEAALAKTAALANWRRAVQAFRENGGRQPDPEFAELDAIEWWPDLWSHRELEGV